MNTPRVVILDTNNIVSKFFTQAAKMAVCEYDMDEILSAVFGTIGSVSKRDSPDGALMALNIKLYARLRRYDLSENDDKILRRAVSALAHDIRDVCIQMGMYDERGRMEYFPTGWLCGGDIVLHHIDEGIVKWR